MTSTPVEIDGALVAFDPLILKGNTGLTGLPGAAGQVGATTNLTMGTVTSVPNGQAASASLTGVAPNQTLNLVLPSGPTGPGGGAVQSVNGHVGVVSLSAADVGATATALNALNVFNVKNYGAAGDGVTVDSVAVAAAITAATATGGIVYLPPGTYVVSGLELASNITLAGSGWSSRLLMDPAQGGSYPVRVCNSSASASNVHVRDLCIDGNQATFGNSSNARNIGYYLGVASGHTIANCTVRNVEFKNCKSYALDIECQSGGTMTGTLVDGCYIHDNGFTSGSGSNIAADGVSAYGDDIKIMNVYSYNNAGNGFSVGQDGVTWHRVDLINCHAYGNAKHGLSIASAAGVIADCHVIGGAYYNNIGTGRSGIQLGAGAIGCVVSGVSATGNSQQGIRLDGCTYCVVTGCTVDSNAVAGSGNPEIYLTDTATNNVVIGNVVSATSATNGIAEQNSTSGPNVVIGNMIKTGAISPQGAGSVWKNNLPLQPKGHSVSQPTMPATTVAATIPAGTAQQDCMVYVTAGTAATTIAVAGTTALVVPSSGVGSVYVPAGSTATPTYASGSPTWTWFGV